LKGYAADLVADNATNHIISVALGWPSAPHVPPRSNTLAHTTPDVAEVLVANRCRARCQAAAREPWQL